MLRHCRMPDISCLGICPAHCTPYKIPHGALALLLLPQRCLAGILVWDVARLHYCPWAINHC